MLEGLQLYSYQFVENILYRPGLHKNAVMYDM